MGAPSFPIFFRTLSKPWHISRSAPIAPRQCRELKNRQWALHTWLHIAGDFLQALSRSPQWCSRTPLHADWPGLFSSERCNCNYTCLVSKLLPDKKAILLSVWVGKGCWLSWGQGVYKLLMSFYCKTKLPSGKMPQVPKSSTCTEPINFQCVWTCWA